MLSFHIEKVQNRARAGVIRTQRGKIKTPVFMPVGTQGSVKAVTHRILSELGVEVILGNTYHLYLRPGEEVIREAGGLHRFIGWDKPILTDSGGYQVFSLASERFSGRKAGVKVSDEGVEFRDHLAGDLHLFTPERVIELQKTFGSDFIMPLDHCLPYPATREDTREAMMRTIDWLKRSVEALGESEGQALFGIVQGGFEEDLRRESALRTLEIELPGYAIGGLSVGEPKELLYSITSLVCSFLPPDKPRYLMGVGKPQDILLAVAEGVDMFDCVVPTRSARTGTLFTSRGVINIKQARFKKDFSPLDPYCECYTCQNFTRSYLRHLFVAQELTAYTLNTIHNLHFYINLMRDIRKAILEGRYEEFMKEKLEKLSGEAT